MSDFDQKDIAEEVKSDFDPADIHVEASTPEEISKLKSFQKGAEQGLTLGSGDELLGIQGAGMDATQALLNKLGLMGPSPSQVNAKLAKDGFTGDIGPKSVLDSYRETRDSARKDYEQAQQANPMSSLAGNVTGGGLLFGGAGKVLSPIALAPEASLGTKVATSALNAVRPGALLGLGNSQADLTKGEFAPVVEDVAKDTAMGMAIGGALPLVGAGLSKVKNTIGNSIERNLPSVARAYEKGKQGINTAGETFVDTTNEKLSKLTNTLKEYTLQARNKFNQQNDEAIGALNNQIKGVQDDISHEIGLTKKLSEGLNEGQKIKLENEKLQLAGKIQDKVQDAKAGIGATYNTIENQIADKNVRFKMNNEISQLGEDLQVQGLLPEQADSLIGPLKPYFEQGDLDLNTLKQLKLQLVKRMESMNPGVRSAFKRAYGRVAENQIQSIEQAGLTDTAKALKNTNQKYMGVLDMEDNFLGKLAADRVTKQNMVNNETLNTINGAIKPDAKNLNNTAEFFQKLNIIDPQFNQSITPEVQALAQKANNINNFKPQVDPNSLDFQSSNKLLQELQAKQAALKAGPEVKTQMGQLLQSDEKGINDYIGNNIKNVNNPIMEPNRQNIENVLESYKQSSGKNLKPQVQELIKDTELIKSAHQSKAMTVSPRGLRFGEATLQGPANVIGRSVKPLSDAKEFVTNGIKKLTDLGDQDMGTLLQRMQGKGTVGQEYANVLQTTVGKPSHTKNAIIFGLMQQPGFRQLFHDDIGTEGDGQ